MELKTTNHSYYCNDANYYNDANAEFETWKEFKEEWLDENMGIDHDYNHCFRFDIVNRYTPETGEELEDEFSLKLYMMLQRKGVFIPITISKIEECDMPEIESYLSDCWAYLKNQWKELSE